MSLALGCLTWAAGLTAPVEAGGRYERRRAGRGEITDTSARLGPFAFIDDTESPPLRLAAFADVAGFREPLVPGLVPVRVGVAYRGRGEPLALSPSAFRLSSAALSRPLEASSQDEILALPHGRAALSAFGRALAARHAPQPFGAVDGLRIPTAFHADPSRSVALNDRTELPPGAWFTDVLFFRLPPDFDPWGPLLRLSFVGEDEAELVGVDFRVEADPELHRRAFRRARKARRQDDRRHREQERQAARRAARAPSPPR